MAAVLNLTGTMFIQGTLHETRADLCSLFEHSHAAAVLMKPGSDDGPATISVQLLD